jgi:hypothetical protein
MIELTHATQQALSRIATAPATSDQAQRSAVAELLEVAKDAKARVRCQITTTGDRR